jgi:hypothetical protein
LDERQFLRVPVETLGELGVSALVDAENFEIVGLLFDVVFEELFRLR